MRNPARAQAAGPYASKEGDGAASLEYAVWGEGKP